MAGWGRTALVLVAVAMAGQAWAQGTTTPAPEAAWGTKDTITLTVAIIGAVTGVLGAVLGGLNTWNTISARRVRVKVVPAFAFTDEPGPQVPIFSIEAVNLSTFPVTVAEVGFAFSRRGRRTPITSPIMMDKKPWPRRLEARDAVSAFFSPVDFVVHAREIKAAYVRLSSGEIIKGQSPALKQLVKMMKDVQREG